MLGIVSRACRERLVVEIHYRDARGHESERRLEPLGIVSAGRRWYLAARDERLVIEKKDGRRPLVSVGEKARTIPSQHLAREHFGVERGEAGADAGGDESVSCPLDQVVDGDHDAVASFSFSV